MKTSRRDSRLDAFIGQQVKIEFKDGTIKTGILEFNGHGTASKELKVGFYRLDYFHFCKNNVKRIKALGDEKWVNLKSLSAGRYS